VRSTIINNLKARFDAHCDMIGEVDDATLVATVDVPKHKTLRDHLWCVVGARQSYAKAVRAGQWSGFENSMTSYTSADFKLSLASTAADASAALDEVTDWTGERDQLLSGLYEHEVMHEGQIIRHMYALGKSLPKSWVWS
jgi:hypothetical protein